MAQAKSWTSSATKCSVCVPVMGEVAGLKQLVGDLRYENARLKGVNGRPRIKPSGMEDASQPKRPGKRGKRQRRGKIVPRVTMRIG